MTKILFRPFQGQDREERLESEALQAALETALPGQVIVSDVIPDDTTHFFGRTPRWGQMPRGNNYPGPEHSHVPYWEWDAFRAYARRDFWVLPLDAAEAKVADLHDARRDAFVKSTRQKQFVASVPRGTTLARELDALVYSFIDAGPKLIVQDFVEIRGEYRIFVVDGLAVTGSGKVMAHTPQDNPGQAFTTFVPDRLHGPASDPALSERYRAIADEAIAKIPVRSYALDMGLINGEPGIVEVNPLQLGQVGLFACDVNRLTYAVLQSCGLIAAKAAA